MERLNDFLVWCRCKTRIGKITDGSIIDVSTVMGGGVCVKSRVEAIEYVYAWCSPFEKVTNAKKKKVPFIKHTNPDCPHQEGKA